MEHAPLNTSDQSCEEQIICTSRPDLGTVEPACYWALHFDR